MRMEFFDGNCCYGRMLTPPPRSAQTVAELLAEMDFCGIDEALVLHAASVYDSQVVGNELVIAETRDQPRLHPTWTILPSYTRELGTAEEFVSNMQAHGVKALHAFPELHNYLLNGLTFGDLFELMMPNHIPLFLHRAEWQKITELLQEFPELTIVRAGFGSWGWDRYAGPLLENFANFYLDISAFELAGGLETHCKRHWAERLLFGTSYPEYVMGGPRLTLLHADISEEDKIAIAGGNLRRLLEEVPW